MTESLGVVCGNATETQAVAGAIAPLLEPGDVILLDGDLGAGKTTFTQGLARALGVTEVVTSPTFILTRIYPTTSGFDLVHVDVYRLERLSEVVDLALPELLDEGAVAVIEWGQRAVPALAPDFLQVRFALLDDEGERQLSFGTVGPRWLARRADLAAVLPRPARSGPP
jgi:tRNA threonylcarbamoyladenosine biosynthesis protein TsaE